MNSTKICPKCARELDLSEFNWKVKDIKKSVHCKECSRKYIRDHYKNNRGYYLAKSLRRNSRLREDAHKYIYQYLLNHPCIDCGETDIVVLEFDHKDRSMKDIEISSIIRQGYRLDRIITEIEKCDVRCANCHRRKTAKESNSWKLNIS